MKITEADGTLITDGAGAGAGGAVANPQVITWQAATPAGGNQALTISKGGKALLILTFTTAEAAALGTALGGTGGTPAAANGP